MTAATLAHVPRQSAILALVAAFHAGAFLVIASTAILPRLPLPRDHAIQVLLPPPVPEQRLLPEVPMPDEFAPGQVEMPIVAVPVVPGDAPDVVAVVEPGLRTGSAVSGTQVGDYRPPMLEMHRGRLATLIDGCYPSAARRLDEQGRARVRIVIDTEGRAASWTVAESTGFSRLDSAIDCVVRRLEFQPGRRDGRAIVDEVHLPIVFRLN